jgi:hypothetical protein
MSDSYHDLSSADRYDLEEALESLTYEEILGALFDKFESVLDDLKDRHVLGANDITRSSLRDAILEVFGRRLCGSVLAEFVDELGRRGWEVLPPARVREVRRRLTILNAATAALTKRKRSGNTTRRPRVKKLKET